MDKINYDLDENGFIIGYSIVPFDENKDYMELEYIPKDIFIKLNSECISNYKVVNGKLIKAINPKMEELKKQALRKERSKLFKEYIDRGKLWYDTLTEVQLKELETWREKWLNVTDTFIKPEMPYWLK